MAPSFEMSSVGQLPLPQASPVHAISAAIRQYQFEHTATGTPSASQFCESSTSDIATVTALAITPGVASQPIAWRMAAGEAAEALASMSTLFLVRETPLTSANRLPQFIPSPLTPTHRQKHQLLDVDPKNETKRTYQDALRQSYTREDQSKAELIRVQSSVVLQAMFCERLSSQLAAQEEKQKSAHKKKGKLVGDGLPRLLTGDEFHGRVVEHEKVVVEEDKAREERRKQRDERVEVMGPWKEAETARLERNRVQRQTYKDELALWEAERDLAKVERRRTRWAQPKLGKLESPLPKPVVFLPDKISQTLRNVCQTTNLISTDTRP